jgi:hypothetical protein
VLNVFTLLIFQGSDSVSQVRTIRADTVEQARRTAEMIMQTHPAAAGHQLWRDGQCISRTYPTTYPLVEPAQLPVDSRNQTSKIGHFVSGESMSFAGE